MKKTYSQVLSTMIEYLPAVVAAGIIAILLGLGIVSGQLAAARAPATPRWSALVVGGALVVIGAIVVAAPLIASFVKELAARAQQEDALTVRQETTAAQDAAAAGDDEDEAVAE